MRIILAAAIMLMFCMNVSFFLHKQKSIGVEVLPPVTQPVRSITPSKEELIQPLHPKRVPAAPKFVTVPEFRSTGENNTVYNDVLGHSPNAPFGNAHGRSTNVHETAHGIHSYLRNKYTFKNGNRVNGFYVLKGRGVIIEEPKMRKSHINKFVPQNLRSYRYNTYLAGQQAWDNTPLYIYDEWVAYVLGGKCNIDDVRNGRHKGGWTDGVSGCLGFSIYAVATAMAVQEHDPAYWESNQQFRDFTIWMLRESYETFKIGRDMDEFKWQKQEDLLKEFLTSSEAKPMRDFIEKHLDGVWLDAEIRVFYGADHELPEPASCGCHFGKRHI